MENALIFAVVIQWALLIGLGVIVLAMVRQIGLLHQRLRPAGALVVSKGIKVGEAAPQVVTRTIDDRQLVIGAASTTARSTLVMFVAPDCPVCAKLLPALKSIAHQERKWLEVILASDGDPISHQQFRQKKGLEMFPYVVSTELGLAYQVSRLPHGVLLDERGVVVAQGLCNNREHIESLFEARRLGVSTLQDYALKGALQWKA